MSALIAAAVRGAATIIVLGAAIGVLGAAPIVLGAGLLMTAPAALVPYTAVLVAGRVARSSGCIPGFGGPTGSGPPAPHVEGPAGGRRTCHDRLSATIRAASWGKRTASSAASPCS